MPRVKYIKSPDEISAGVKYLLVKYGDEYVEQRHAAGLTITVARQRSKTVSELSFLTAVHTAKGIAKREGIADIFVCGAAASGPSPTIPPQKPAGKTSSV
jgi:hypothetical protein